MRFDYAHCIAATCFLGLIAGLPAQETAGTATVPRLVRFAGSFDAPNHQPPAGLLGATFSVYREQEGGAPLWSETQNIEVDPHGDYSVLLGSTKNEGMSPELFASSEPRWLGVRFNLPNEVEHPRILLASVPYALKASDADTLGGRPASSYLLAEPTGPGPIRKEGESGSPAAMPTAVIRPLANSGTPNFIAKFINTTDVGNSLMFENNGQVSVGGTTALGALTLIGNVAGGDAPGMALFNQGGGGGASVSLDFYNTTANSGIPQAKLKALDDGNYSDHLTIWTKAPGAPSNPVTEKMRITSVGNVGIGTNNPGDKLEVNGGITSRIDGGAGFGPAISLKNLGGFGIGSLDLYTYAGQTVPSARWQAADVGGFTADQIFYTSAGGSANQPLAARMIIKGTSGNVGIGTTSPGTKLEVAGNLKVSGAGNGITFPDGTTQTTAPTGGGVGPVVLPLGSAAAPSLSFTGNSNTGIFSAGANTFNIATNGTNRLTVRSDGDVDLPGSIRKGGLLFLHNLGAGNTAVGLSALLNSSTGGGNTALGFSALLNNVTGNFNTASGYQALSLNTSGTANTATGAFALDSNTTGSQNTAIGNAALNVNTTASGNTAVGNSALASNTTGNSNTATGNSALLVNTTGIGNTATGEDALDHNTGGNHNTAHGLSALTSNVSGNDNTAIGWNALSASTGSSNIGIGQNAGFSLTSGDSNIYIGSDSAGASESNTIRLGFIGQTRTFIGGIRGTTTVANDAIAVLIDSNGQLGTISSSIRFKEAVQDMGDVSDGLLRLRPVTYRYKQPYGDGSQPLDYGLIAEEVADVFPDLVVKGKDGQVETVQYHKLTPMLLNELQKQHTELAKLRSELRSEHEQNRKLEERLAALETLVSGKALGTSASGQ